MKVFCLFEQSGTFKNSFKKLGYKAYDYDIENNFNETDFIIDLFSEIDKYFNEQISIFDKITKNDLVMSFFPCIYFSGQNELYYNRKFRWFKYWTEEKIDNYINDRLNKRDEFFNYFLKMIDIAKIKGFKMIVENPYKNNYLLKAYNKAPDVIIKDRSKLGDNHIKPTMFYYYNLIPANNDIFIEENNKTVLRHNDYNGFLRKQLHPDFAINFIKKYIIKRLDI